MQASRLAVVRPESYLSAGDCRLGTSHNRRHGKRQRAPIELVLIVETTDRRAETWIRAQRQREVVRALERSLRAKCRHLPPAAQGHVGAASRRLLTERAHGADTTPQCG